jgi:hypothetical protein
MYDVSKPSYAVVLTMLPLLLLAKLLEFTQSSAYLDPHGKQKLGSIVEAVDPFTWAPTSISDMYMKYMMSHNLHMLLMCLCI